MREVSILLVGNTDRAEFRQARIVLERLARLTLADNVDTAVARASDMDPPADLVVLAQAFPGEFSCEAVDRLRERVPLARIVGLLGSWCEGEVRTGQPWPGAIRVYAHQWLGRAEEELERLTSGSGSTWSLPATASEEERFLAAAQKPFPPGAKGSWRSIAGSSTPTIGSPARAAESGTKPSGFARIETSNSHGRHGRRSP